MLSDSHNDGRRLHANIKHVITARYPFVELRFSDDRVLGNNDDVLCFITTTSFCGKSGADFVKNRVKFCVDTSTRDIWILPSPHAIVNEPELTAVASTLMELVFDGQQSRMMLHCFSRIANLRDQVIDAWEQMAGLTAMVADAKEKMEQVQMECNVWISQRESLDHVVVDTHEKMERVVADTKEKLKQVQMECNVWREQRDRERQIADGTLVDPFMHSLNDDDDEEEEKQEHEQASANDDNDSVYECDDGWTDFIETDGNPLVEYDDQEK